MKKLIIWLLLICLLLAGCGAAQEPEQTEAPTEAEEATEATEEATEGMDLSAYANTARVLCYNIYYKDVDRRAADIQDLILKNDPDILLLQEVSLDWLPHMQSFMDGNGYSYYGYGRYGGEMSAEEQIDGDQYIPILWKTDKYDLVESGHFWLSSTPDVVKSSDWVDGTTSKFPRCVNYVILKDKQSGGELVTMNIHTDPESDMVRTNSCALAVEKLSQIANGRSVVIGGDWNMGLMDTGYSIMTSSGYLDLRVHAIDADTSGSFNAWGDREEGNFAYGDHIFMSEDMAAELFDVVEDYYNGEHISDHNPLLAIVYY